MFEEEYPEVEQELSQNVEKIKKAVKRKKGTRKKSKRKEESGKEIPLHISRFEEVLEELWEFFKSLDVGTRIKFFTFLDKRNFVPQVMALLYLDYDNKIRLYQEKPFGDLEVEILET